MSQRGVPLREYAWCALITAHSLAGGAGDLPEVLGVRSRMLQAGVPPTVRGRFEGIRFEGIRY